MNRVVRWGGSLSLILFNNYADVAFTEALPGVGHEELLNWISTAEYTVLIAQSEKDLNSVIEQLSKARKRAVYLNQCKKTNGSNSKRTCRKEPLSECWTSLTARDIFASKITDWWASNSRSQGYHCRRGTISGEKQNTWGKTVVSIENEDAQNSILSKVGNASDYLHIDQSMSAENWCLRVLVLPTNGKSKLLLGHLLLCTICY